MENLLKINSRNIGYMDSVLEYQKLYINDKIGTILNSTKLNVKREFSIYFKSGIDVDTIWEKLENNYTIYSTTENKITITSDNFIAEMWDVYNSSHLGMVLSLSSDTIKNVNKYKDEIVSILEEFLVPAEGMIAYTILQYENGENLNETYYQDNVNIDFNPLAVPFIDDVDNYIKEFLNSSAPILILQGEPGTGKTTFTKYLLSIMAKESKEQLRALYSFDENVFFISNFFKRMIYAKYDILILEDVNQIIHKNADDTGNLNPLNKFISVTDGLISKKTKIIITTNITSKSQLHPALLRPGRCHDVIQFRSLEGVEIDNLCDSCAKDLDLQIESINISEFYAKCNNTQNQKLLNTKIGF